MAWDKLILPETHILPQKCFVYSDGNVCSNWSHELFSRLSVSTARQRSHLSNTRHAARDNYCANRVTHNTAPMRSANAALVELMLEAYLGAVRGSVSTIISLIACRVLFKCKLSRRILLLTNVIFFTKKIIFALRKHHLRFHWRRIPSSRPSTTMV